MQDFKKNPATRYRVVRVRVNDKEYAEFNNRARELGYSTVSDFLRSLIRKRGNDNEVPRHKQSNP